MATEVVKIIDPNNGTGTDYTSLSAWEAAQQGDLTGVRNEIAVAKCRCTGGTADGKVTLAGWTTSATQYVKIWTDPSEAYRHNGTYQTGNKYRIETSGSSFSDYAIWVNTCKNIKIIGIQTRRTIANSANGLGGIVFYQNGDGVDGLVDSCIVRGYVSTDSYGFYGIEWYAGTDSEAQSGSMVVINNIVYDFKNSGVIEAGIAFTDTANASNMYAYNNTVHNCGKGLWVQARTGSYGITAKNNIVQDCDDGFNGSFTHLSYNVTDLAESLDEATYHNRNSTTVTFVDEANDNFHLSESDTGARGYGVNLYNDATYPFQSDVDSESRGGSGATWDIGADEYVVYDLSIYASECVGSEGMFG